MYITLQGISGSSAGKESICNTQDPGSIPQLGWSAGEGIGYPLQYSWASLVGQLAKNLPAMQETWVRSLGWEDPLEKGTTTHSSILAWRFLRTEEPGRLQSMGLKKGRHNWVIFTFTYNSSLQKCAKMSDKALPLPTWQFLPLPAVLLELG